MHLAPLELISLLVATAALFGWISLRWLKLPITIGTMLLTVAVSVVLASSATEYAPGLRIWALKLVEQINFESLILHGMLPLLLFAGAFLLELEYLANEKLIVTLLSILGTVLSTGLTAGLMFVALWALRIPASWIACLFFGALISPTDPIAVLEMLRRVGVPKNIQAQLAGESLFNDGIAAVLFLAILEASRGLTPTVGQVALSLLLKAGGGLCVGIVAAWITSQMMRMVDSYQVEILLTIALALGGYVLADRLLVSGPLEAVAAAIALRHFNRKHKHKQIAHESIDRFWEVIDEVQNSVLFVLLGLEVLAISFRLSSFESGALAIVLVTAIRLGVVAAIVGLVRLLQRDHSSSILTLSWGGLRGGLSIALALAVPAGDGRAWILATTYIVVVFSIIVQGGSMDRFLRRHRIAAATEAAALAADRK
jgi:CPA1 family monovalent cation:H+ antiporter